MPMTRKQQEGAFRDFMRTEGAHIRQGTATLNDLFAVFLAGYRLGDAVGFGDAHQERGGSRRRAKAAQHPGAPIVVQG